MKKQGLVIILGIVILGALAMSFYQWQNSQALSQEKEKLSRDTQQSQVANQELKVKLEGLQRKQEREAATQLRMAQQKESEAQNNLNSPDGTASSSFATTQTNGDSQNSAGDDKTKKNPMAQLLNAPGMKEMVKTQQRMVMNSAYRDFIKQVSLTPQESEAFMKLIEEEQMKQFEGAQHILSGDTNHFNMRSSVREQMKELLGEERYTQYRDYKKTLAERIMANTFSDQMVSSEVPLEPYQKQQLTQILVEESKNNSSTSKNETINSSDDPQKIIEAQFTKQRELNERVLLRAKTVLNDKQIIRLKEFQNNVLAMQEASVKMMKQYMEKP